MRYPPFLQVNIETVLKSIVLVGFATWFTILTTTGRIREYLHPRLIPFLLFAAVFFLIMVFSLLHDFKRKGRRFSIAPYLIFLLPLALAFTVPPRASANSVPISIGNLQTVSPQTKYSVNNSDAGIPDESWIDLAPSTEASSNQIQIETQTVFGNTVTLTITENRIDLTDDNFVSWMNELGSSPEKYAGRDIDYEGYIATSNLGLPEDEFVLARDMMWCCAADVQMIGCLCRFNDTYVTNERTWVHVDGVIDTEIYNETTIPVIVCTTVEAAERPADEYVYALF